MIDGKLVRRQVWHDYSVPKWPVPQIYVNSELGESWRSVGVNVWDAVAEPVWDSVIEDRSRSRE